jgi:hypothetical protein
LHDKFKQYNWFLPSSGELIRILYYIYQCTALPYRTDLTKFPDANAFQYAVQNNIINIANFYINSNINTSVNQYWSSSQAPNGPNNNPDGGYAADITITNNENSIGNYNVKSWKYQIKNVIPVCKF